MDIKVSLFSLFLFHQSFSHLYLCLIDEGNNYQIGLRQFLNNLNLFQTSSTDPETIQQQKISTQVYLVLFILSIIGLTLYAALSLRTITVTKNNPSEVEFQRLYARYSSTIKCVCSRIAIPYSEFTRYDATFHEVCSSEFISQTWIDAVYVSNRRFLVPNDMRMTLSTFWQTIRMLCALMQKTKMAVLDDFTSTLMLTPETQPRWLLERNTKTALQFSLTNAIASLRRNLLFTQRSIVGNHLMSGLGTNFQFPSGIYNSNVSSILVPVPNKLANVCSCWDLDGCSQAAVVFEMNETIIPGMTFNCQPFRGILSSSLECFYQPWCISLLDQSLSMNITPMPLLIAESRFAHNTTIETLVEELMIEQWTNTTSFDLYYTQCDPTHCTYSYSERMNVAYVVTFIIAAFGGLSFALRLSIPLLVKLVFVIHKWLTRHRAAPHNDESAHRSSRKLLLLTV